MPEIKNPTETPVAVEAPEVSRRRKMVAAAASISTTVVLTIATNVVVGLASQKVTDLIMNQNQNKAK